MVYRELALVTVEVKDAELDGEVEMAVPFDVT